MKELIDFLFVRDDSFVGLRSMGLNKEGLKNCRQEISQTVNNEIDNFYKGCCKPILYLKDQSLYRH